MKILSLIFALCCIAPAMPAMADLLPEPERYMQKDPFSSDVDVTSRFAMEQRANARSPIPSFSVTVPGPCNMRAVISLASDHRRHWICYTYHENPGPRRFIIPIPPTGMQEGETARFIMHADVRLHRYEKERTAFGRHRYIYVDDKGEQHQCEAAITLERKGPAIAPADRREADSASPGDIPAIWLTPREDKAE